MEHFALILISVVLFFRRFSSRSFVELLGFQRADSASDQSLCLSLSPFARKINPICSTRYPCTIALCQRACANVARLLRVILKLGWYKDSARRLSHFSPSSKLHTQVLLFLRLSALLLIRPFSLDIHLCLYYWSYMYQSQMYNSFSNCHIQQIDTILCYAIIRLNVGLISWQLYIPFFSTKYQTKYMRDSLESGQIPRLPI